MIRRRFYAVVLIIAMAMLLTACSGSNEAQENEEPEQNTESTEEDNGMGSITMKINDEEMTVTWEDNESVEALADLVSGSPLTIDMSMYGGFEQVGPIGQELPREDVQTETGPGDIVLYAGDQMVIFYGNNSWAYTRLGHINLPQEKMAELLGNGDATVILHAEE